MLFENVEIDFPPTSVVSPCLEVGYFSPVDKSTSGHSPAGTPLMDIDKNFGGELASSMESHGNTIDAISPTDRSDEDFSEDVPSIGIFFEDTSGSYTHSVVVD